MWTGGTLGTGLSYHDFFLAVLIGNLLLGIYTSFLGYIGAKTGLTTHLLARFSFGVKGSWLPSLLLGGTQVGWFGVGVAMFAIPVGKATGLDINLLIAVSGLLMTVTVFFGISALTVLSVIAVPAIACLGGYSVWLAVNGMGGLDALKAVVPAQPLDFNVALALVAATYANGYVKNKVMEFVGPGIASLPTDYRNGIDVMTTETTCLSSVWQTDGDTKSWLDLHKRGDDYRELKPARVAYYDALVEVDLSAIKPMIALPFHPSNAYTIDALYENLEDILRETELAAEKVAEGRAHFSLLDKVTSDGKLTCQQGVIAGCAGGTYSNIVEAAHALKGASTGYDEFYLSVYPSSQPVFVDLDRKGLLADLMDAGAIVRTAFCGPCFGAGDTPAHNALSIRHATRNFPNREGSKPQNGQMAAVALMDARSIAATAVNGGKLTSATELDCWGDIPAYNYDDRAYQSRVYWGFGKANDEQELRYGPNIKDWPEQEPLADNILLRIVSKIEDEVTTTDELIPSGETSSYRSNPLGLAEFTLSRRDPDYVRRAKQVRDFEQARLAGELPDELDDVYEAIHGITGFEDVDAGSIEIGSTIYARKPGDGSAREQAASCQRVLGALANIVEEYATKRYRSNCMNWGMLPFQYAGDVELLNVGDWAFVPSIRDALDGDLSHIRAFVIGDAGAREIELSIADMTSEERAIVKAGCLINYNREK